MQNCSAENINDDLGQGKSTKAKANDHMCTGCVAGGPSWGKTVNLSDAVLLTLGENPAPELETARSAQVLAETELQMALFHSRIEETETLAKRAIEICESIGSQKVESNANFSTNPTQEIISREKVDEILKKLNVIFEKHMRTYFAEKSNDDLDQRKSNGAKAN